MCANTANTKVSDGFQSLPIATHDYNCFTADSDEHQLQRTSACRKGSCFEVPSGNLTVRDIENHHVSICFRGKPSISMGNLYHSYVRYYQRVETLNSTHHLRRLQRHPLAWPHADRTELWRGLAPWEDTTDFIQVHIFTCISAKKKKNIFPQKKSTSYKEPN